MRKMGRYCHSIMCFLLIVALLVGCSAPADTNDSPTSAESKESMIDRRADYSGDLDYFASLAGKNLDDQILEVTGIYTGGMLGIHSIGEMSDDFYVSLSFETKNDEVKALNEGDIITVKGECISSNDDHYQLSDAVLISVTQGDPDYDKPKKEDVSHSGDAEYFQAIVSSDLEDEILEVTGVYTDEFWGNYYLGDRSEFHFVVDFDEKTEEIENLALGNVVTARGRCIVANSSKIQLMDAILVDVQDSLPIEETVPETTEPELKVYAPIAGRNNADMSADEVVALFVEAGFTDIVTEEIELDYDPDVEYESGYVKSVAIDDEYFFEKNDAFAPDAPVVVTYVTYPENVSPPTEPPTETEPPATEESKSEAKVWIPQSGSKYHSRKGCSNMKNPTEVTEKEAKARGYTACKRCY